jgi:dTDP-4-dehydrorhamnose 3,5-epimerase
MDFIATKFSDAWLIKPKVNQDNRGFFLESYRFSLFKEHGIACHFVQDNCSRSVASGVLRGLHFQRPPLTQAKLMRVISGAVYDVILDLRRDSTTYGQWQDFTLTADNFLMLFVPRGFAHGFCTMQPDTEFTYKVDNEYSPAHESGILWNDPTLGIPWPAAEPVLSAKDMLLPEFKSFNSPF